MKRVTPLGRTVAYYNESTASVHRFVAKPLTMKDNIEYARYKNRLMERSKADEIDDEELLGMSNYPLVHLACASYHVVRDYEPPEGADAEQLNADFATLEWGNPVEITEDVFLDLAEPFIFGILEAIYDCNPDRRYELDVLKKIMESVKESPFLTSNKKTESKAASETGSDANS